MSRAPIKWAAALVISGALHAGAAAVLGPREQPELVEGGQQAEVALLGTMFVDQVSAGEQNEQAEPVETTATTSVSEVVTTAAAARPTAAVQQPTIAAQPVEAAQAARAQTIEAAIAEDIAEIEPTSQPTIAALTPSEAVSDKLDEVPAAEAGVIEPADRFTEVAGLVNVPLPSPRPDYTPAAVPRTEKPKAEPQRQKARIPPPPKRAGSHGRNEADARKGVADGSEAGKNSAQGKKGNSQIGNAAASNYPGTVSSKLRRALRYPAAARRDRLRGEVHVAFTVSRSGNVGSVRVVRSSGSPVLDKAAIETVQRAAPFPPIPQGAGKSSWPFTVPLSFTR